MTISTTHEEAGKQPYEAPRMVIYGDLREMTKGSPTGPNSDSPMGSFIKTV